MLLDLTQPSIRLKSLSAVRIDRLCSEGIVLAGFGGCWPVIVGYRPTAGYHQISSIEAVLGRSAVSRQLATVAVRDMTPAVIDDPGLVMVGRAHVRSADYSRSVS